MNQQTYALNNEAEEQFRKQSETLRTAPLSDFQKVQSLQNAKKIIAVTKRKSYRFLFVGLVLIPLGIFLMNSTRETVGFISVAFLAFTVYGLLQLAIYILSQVVILRKYRDKVFIEENGYAVYRYITNFGGRRVCTIKIGGKNQ